MDKCTAARLFKSKLYSGPEAMLGISRPGFSQTFPSKFSTLPSIQYGNDGSRNSGDNQFAPVRSDPRNFSPDNEMGGERLRQLELRLHVAERSNQALLEELVRTQNELRTEARRTEEALRSERAARANFEGALRSNADLLSQLSSRMQRADEQLNEGRLTVVALANQLRGTEQVARQGVVETAQRRDALSSKIDQLSSHIEQSEQARDQLERVIFQLTNELQLMRGRVETQSTEILAVSKELKNRSSKLEMDNRMAVENIRRNNENHSQVEQSTYLLRNQVDQRLIELRDAFNEIRAQQDRDRLDARAIEQQLTAKLAEYQAATGEDGRRRDEQMHSLEMTLRERDRAYDMEHTKLNTQMTEMFEEINRRLVQREMKLKEEQLEKYAQLEKLLTEEKAARKKFEKYTKEDAEQMWVAARKQFDEELKRLLDLHVTDIKKAKDNLSKLNEAIDLMDQHIDEQKKHLERLIAAEIQSRQQQERQFGSRLNDAEDKLATNNRSLQESVSQLSLKMSIDTQAQASAISELETKLAALSRTVEDVEPQIRAVMAVAESSDKYDILKNEMDSLIEAESDARKRDVESLQVQLVKRAEVDSRDRDANQSRVFELQENLSIAMEKLEELNSNLGIKVQKEEKQRVHDVQNLQDIIDDLRNKVDELLAKQPSAEDAEDNVEADAEADEDADAEPDENADAEADAEADENADAEADAEEDENADGEEEGAENEDDPSASQPASRAAGSQPTSAQQTGTAANKK